MGDDHLDSKKPQVAELLQLRMSRMLVTDLSGTPHRLAMARAQRYSALVNDAIDRQGFGPSLFRTSPEILIRTKATIRMVVDPEAKHIVGGLHTDYSNQLYALTEVERGELSTWYRRHYPRLTGDGPEEA